MHGSRLDVLGESHQETLSAASDLGEMLGRRSATRGEALALLRVSTDALCASLGDEHRLHELTRRRLEYVERAIGRGDGDDAVAADEAGDYEAGGELVACLIHIFVAPAERRRGGARRALPMLTSQAWEAGADAVEALVPCGGAGCAEGAALLQLMLQHGFTSKGDEPLEIGGFRHRRVRLERPADMS